LSGRRAVVRLALLGICLAPSLVLAHHSRAPFDMSRIHAFEGTVVRYQWRNPHVYVIVADQQGAEWLIETDATPVMTRSGWSRDSFSVGDPVSVRIRPDKDPSKSHGLLVSITGVDGRPMTTMNRTDSAGIGIVGASATSLAGVWSGERLGTFEIFAALRNLSLTPAGEAARADYDPSQNPVAACIPWPAPFFMLANGLYLTEVQLGDDVITVRNEFYGTERMIYMDGRGHPESGERTNQGHSVGHWDGDTLVIDTMLFADHRTPFPNSGIPSGEQKHVVERLTLSENGQTVAYGFTVEDPEYLATPLSGQSVWHYAPHLELITIECDPEIAQQYLN
jgi:hypothetical protein